MYTRNGKVLDNFGHITDKLVEQIDNFGRSYVLDGEVVSHSFQDLMKQVHRKSDVQAQDARLCLFDILPLVEFKQGKSVMAQRRRTQFLKNFENIFADTGCIDVIPQIEVNLDEFLGDIEYKDYNKAMVAAGYEGIMIKDPEAKYECKRSVSWLKQKPFIEVSLTVMATEEGTGRNEGKMGALVCEGTDDGKLIKVNVGSGFTDTQREDFWGCRVDGQVVEVRADAVTQNQDGTYSLRFPRFQRFRGFIAGEKI
jgi:DNA ligase-1